MIKNTSISGALRNGWLVVAMLFMVGVLNYLDRTTITTMRTSIVSSIPMSDAQFGLLTSVFLWVYGFLSPIAGFIADRFKRSHVITGSLFVWSAVTWFTAHATTYEELLATRALMGISEAFYLPAALALIVDYHKGKTQSLATGINLAGVMVGQCLGFIGGWLAESHSWNYAFYVLGIIGMVYAVFLLFFLKDPAAEILHPIEKKKDNVVFIKAITVLFKHKSFVFLLLAFGVMGIVSWMVVGWLPTYYMEKFHLSQTMSGLYATIYLYPASIAGLLLGGFLADRWSATNFRARIYIPMIGLAIAAPFVFLATQSDSLVLVISFLLVFGMMKMFFDPNVMPALCLIVDSRYRATGYGVLNMLSTIIGGAGIYIAGLLRDAQVNLNTVYQLAAGVILLCIGCLFIVSKTINNQKTND
jgi:MFS family permease